MTKLAAVVANIGEIEKDPWALEVALEQIINSGHKNLIPDFLKALIKIYEELVCDYQHKNITHKVKELSEKIQEAKERLAKIETELAKGNSEEVPLQ
ncbi:MAG: hypothetical protein R2880_12680 [Deinococcales bacterium]